MSEHWIRLRGGWVADQGDSADSAGWLTLPLAAPPWPDAPRAVRRSFQTPSIDHQREGLWLVIAEMPGIREIRLNGEPIPPDASGNSPREIRLPGHLPRRCLLELELVERFPGPSTGDWGHVALVIREDDPPESAPGESREPYL